MYISNRSRCSSRKYLEVIHSLNGYKSILNLLSFVIPFFHIRAILSFVRLWLDKYISDFDTPPTYDLLTSLEQFLSKRTEDPAASTEGSELLRYVLELRQRLVSGDLVLLHGNRTSEERAIDDLYDWLNFSPVQIAWDLTALDAVS